MVFIKRVFSFLLTICIFFALTACGKETSSFSSSRGVVSSEELQFMPLTEGDTIAVIETTAGNIYVVLYPQYAPLAAQNFVLLAQQGGFDNTEFSRVIKDFVIQGGSTSGTSAYGDAFDIEVTSKLRHYSGALSTAANHDTLPKNNGQFYIVATPQANLNDDALLRMQEAGYTESELQAYKAAGGAPYLDNTDTVFGQVYAGMDVVDAIAGVKTDDNDKPKKEVLILSVSISTYAEGTDNADSSASLKAGSGSS
ncbi:MAG: peptidylprolyl isomerase [Oscillospiraceae bacterium]